jgi:hypothetical protein
MHPEREIFDSHETLYLLVPHSAILSLRRFSRTQQYTPSLIGAGEVFGFSVLQFGVRQYPQKPVLLTAFFPAGDPCHIAVAFVSDM